MLESWRWFGPDDPVTLRQVRQSGAKAIVSALDHISVGEIWPLPDIQDRQTLIAKEGLRWAVVESVPVHADIKLRRGDYSRYISNYQQTLRNLGAAGVDVVCYNFMPVVDWTRTDLDFKLENGAEALRFDMVQFAAYDIYVLQRLGAERDYTADIKESAYARYRSMTPTEVTELEKTIIAGLPGGYGSYNRAEISEKINEFAVLSDEDYRKNLIEFLKEIIPVAEESGVVMGIHPDDPPFRIFGLPRILSTLDDARKLTESIPSSSNGLTMCAGSYGARCDADVVKIVEQLGSRIYFAHLRNIRREPDGSFWESEHLDGDNDMVGIINALLEQEHSRRSSGNHLQLDIPMRPDHGHTMDYDHELKTTKPGYSYVGRLRGLAELRGVIHTLGSLNSLRDK